MNNIGPHAALVGANVIFGFGNIVSKLGLHRFNPLLFALIREVIAGPVLLCISCIVERNRAASAVVETRATLARRFVLSGAAMFGSNACFIVGVKLAGATAGAIWQSAQPIFISLMAVAVGYERCTAQTALGVVVASGGCVFVSTYGATNASGTTASKALLGHCLFFVQLLCVSTFWVSQKPLLRQFPPLVTLAYGYAVATILMSATASAFTTDRALLNLTCADCEGSGWEVPPDAWLAILYYVFAVSVLAYFLNTWGNTRVHASIVGIYGSIQPLVAIGASELIILFSEPPHFGLHGVRWADMGVLAIIGGLWLVVRDTKRMAAAPADDALILKPSGSSDEGADDSAVARFPEGEASTSCQEHGSRGGGRGATTVVTTMEQRLLVADGSSECQG